MLKRRRERKGRREGRRGVRKEKGVGDRRKGEGEKRKYALFSHLLQRGQAFIGVHRSFLVICFIVDCKRIIIDSLLAPPMMTVKVHLTSYHCRSCHVER